MWIYLGTENYLLQLKREEHSVTFYLTNLINVWTADYGINELAIRFRELNPMFDIPENIIVDKIIGLYNSSVGDVSRTISKNPDGISVFSSAKVKNFSYNMEIVLYPTGSEVLLEKFTAPLLVLLNNLVEREQQLVQIIEKKDIEIGEYKLEGVEIKRRGVITEPFSYDKFKSSQTSKNFEPNMSSTLLQGPLLEMLGRQIETAEVKVEEQIQKEEASRTVPRKTISNAIPSIPESAGCLYTEKSEPVKVSPTKRKRFGTKLNL